MADSPVKPSSRRRKVRILAVALLGLVVAAVALATVFVLPTATGYVARLACSGVFVAGHPEAVLREQDLAPQAYVSFEVDETRRRVHASVLGLASRTAVFRPGLGCALAIDVDADALQSVTVEVSHPAAAELPWPRGEAPDVRPDPPGLDRGALEAALDQVFAEPNPDSLRHTRAVAIAYGGRLVAERYADWTDRDAPQLGWSMTKSVTNALVGLLVHRGQLDITQPAPIPAWADDDRRAITLDALLRMSSGLQFEERYGMMADATHMLFEVDDAASVPLAKPLEVPIDSRFSYSSGTSNIVSWIVRQQFDDDASYHRFPHQALFEPLGMRTATLETDASGTFVGSSFMYASARDWARFGQLYLQDGVWEGRRLLPEGWARYSGTATPGAPIGEYGAHFWTNAGAPDDPTNRRFPNVPTDAFQASGFQGQAVLVVPSRDVVIVRLGMTHERAAWDLDTFASEVLAALPEAAE